MNKRCNRCGAEKTLDAFSTSQSNKDGYSCICKKCVSLRNKEYWRTPKGRISQIFATQVFNSRQRKHPAPTYSRKELTTWAEDNGLLDIYLRWKISDFTKDLAPSVDRLDPTQPYTLLNIRLVPWKENNDKAYEDRKSCRHITQQNRRIRQLDRAGNVVAHYDSIASAARITGITRININDVCRKKAHCKSAGGFLWEYADLEETHETPCTNH